jgi:hypothetical protein
MISTAKPAPIPLPKGARHVPPTSRLGALRNANRSNRNNQDGNWTAIRHGRNPFGARAFDPFLNRIDPSRSE